MTTPITPPDEGGHTYTSDELCGVWKALNGAQRERLRWLAKRGFIKWNQARKQWAMLANRGLVERKSVSHLDADDTPVAVLTTFGRAVLAAVIDTPKETA